MARGTAPTAPITVDDLPALRDRVGAGDAPVAYLLVDTAVAAAGARVAVLRVDDPARGDDCVVVRLGDDELPFAPRELSLTPVRRGSAKARAAALALAQPASATALPSTRPSTSGQPSTSTSARPFPSTRGRASTTPRAAAAPATPVAPAAPTTQLDLAPAVPPAPSRSTATPARPRPRRGQDLAVTLRFSGTAWTLEHTAGGRKGTPRPVSPAAVRALADRVDDADIRSSLLDAVERSRKHAAEEAAALRAQLAAVETVLAELDD